MFLCMWIFVKVAALGKGNVGMLTGLCFLIVLCILLLLGSGIISAVECSVVYDRILMDSRQLSSRFIIHSFFVC